MAGNKRIAVFGGVAVAAVVLDQVSKAWARTALAGGPVPLVPGVMDLALVMNTGAAFSIGSGSTWVFVILAAVICAAAAVWVVREKAMPVSLAATLGAVAGGGVGNLIDRVIAGQVTDFLATAFIDFPVFNVADIFVTCGVILSLILAWRFDAAQQDAEGGSKGEGN